MKRKYYLRGLGFGILITAIVFCLVSPRELTDAEIIERATSLGYVKEKEKYTVSKIDLKELMGTGTPTPTVLQEEPPAPTITETPVPLPEPTTEPVITDAPEEVPTLVPTEAHEAEITPEPILTQEPTPEPTPEPEKVVITAQITVEPGNTASMVCYKMQAAGILTDAGAFVNYIVWNNLADYINIGTYTLSSDMTFEEMAKVLTGQQ